jgi:hypothetical protein
VVSRYGSGSKWISPIYNINEVLQELRHGTVLESITILEWAILNVNVIFQIIS